MEEDDDDHNIFYVSMEVGARGGKDPSVFFVPKNSFLATELKGCI